VVHKKGKKVKQQLLCVDPTLMKSTFYHTIAGLLYAKIDKLMFSKGNCTRKSSKDEMAKIDLLILTIGRHEEESNSLI